MATEEQVKNVFARMEEAAPISFFKCIEEAQAGIGAVLRLLYESEETVTAGRISDVLGISTARVAVLIRKMVSKGLITRERSAADARITIVKLTDFGQETIENMKNDMYSQLENIIDAIGENRVLEFIAIAEEIREMMKITPPGTFF